MNGFASIRVAGFLLIGIVGIFLALPYMQRVPVEMRCRGKVFDIEFAPGGKSPYVELRAGQRNGPSRLDYGTTQSSLARDFFSADAAGRSDIVIDNFSLPTFPSGHFLLSSYQLLAEPAGGQLGIIGTDFLSLLTADFSFRGRHSDVVLGALPCDPEALRARGLIGVRQKGFFSRDLLDVDPAMPNVPVLFINIASVFAVAQIDTGYDDRVLPSSIDINDALYDKLVSAGVALQSVGVSTIATCHGIVRDDVYDAPQADVSLRTDEDKAIRSIAGARLIRKKANGCGGIADKALPAAQLGMSIIAGLGSIVFDPSAGFVWVSSGR
jgi:hypothetical protein